MTIEALSDGIADAIAAVGASVVSVRGSRRVPASGLVWGPQHVVTTHHALRRVEALMVVDADDQARSASVVGRDPATDLALLEVDGEPLVVAPLAADAARVGQLVFPVGRTTTLGAAFGLVATVGGPWTTGHGGQVDRWIEVDGSLPRGFSGGPLVSARGEVVGINTTQLSRRGAVVPHATITRVVERLMTHGSVAPGYLGVGFYPGTLPAELAATVGQEQALMAVSLEPGGPGEAAGLLVGDALVHIDEVPMTGLRQLVGMLGALGADREVQLTVLRAGQIVTVLATLGARPPRRRRRGHSALSPE